MAFYACTHNFNAIVMTEDYSRIVLGLINVSTTQNKYTETTIELDAKQTDKSRLKHKGTYTTEQLGTPGGWEGVTDITELHTLR